MNTAPRVSCRATRESTAGDMTLSNRKKIRIAGRGKGNVNVRGISRRMSRYKYPTEKNCP